MIFNSIKTIFSVCLLLLSFLATAQKESSLNQFLWLEGFWVNPDTSAVEQWWNEGVHLFGVVHKVDDIDDYFQPGKRFEILEKLELKIEGDSLVYVAITGEHQWQPVQFVWQPEYKDGMGFYNPTNDFPKWIIYKQINDETLRITIKNDVVSRTFLYHKISPKGELNNE